MWDPERQMAVPNPMFATRAPRSRRPSALELTFSRVVFAAEQVSRQGLDITVSTIRGFNPELAQKDVQLVLDGEKFVRAMEERGIALSANPGLSSIQLAALHIYLDTSVPMSHAQRLRAVGVSQAQWSGWMRQPEFAKRMEALSAERLQETIPVANQRLAELVDRGELKAIRFLYELTGVHDPRMPGVDVMMILQGIFSVLEEEVADAAVLARVGMKVREMLGQKGAGLNQAPLAEPGATMVVHEPPSHSEG